MVRRRDKRALHIFSAPSNMPARPRARFRAMTRPVRGDMNVDIEEKEKLGMDALHMRLSMIFRDGRLALQMLKKKRSCAHATFVFHVAFVFHSHQAIAPRVLLALAMNSK